MIRAIILDLDNTLTDFMKMKGAAIDAALDGMVDAGLPVSREVLREHIWRVYNDRGIEYQQVFDLALMEAVGSIDPRVLAAGIVAYRKTRESTLVTYPHVQYTLLGFLQAIEQLGELLQTTCFALEAKLCRGLEDAANFLLRQSA